MDTAIANGLAPHHEIFTRATPNIPKVSPSLKKWMGGSSGRTSLLLAGLATFPVFYITLPLLLLIRNADYKGRVYTLHADDHTLTMRQGKKAPVTIDLRRVEDIRVENDGNIFLYSKARGQKKVKLFSVADEAFIKRLIEVQREAVSYRNFQRNPTDAIGV